VDAVAIPSSLAGKVATSAATTEHWIKESFLTLRRQLPRGTIVRF
jgi:hypothetical protein